MGLLSAMGKPWNNQLAQWDGKTGYFSWFTWPIYSQAFLIYQWAIFHSHILGFPHVGNELYIWKHHTFEMIDALGIIYITCVNIYVYTYIYKYIYIYVCIYICISYNTYNIIYIIYNTMYIYIYIHICTFISRYMEYFTYFIFRMKHGWDISLSIYIYTYI